MSRLKLPKERPGRPFVGYKLAFPMLSADGTRTGFAGVMLGRSQVYGPVAEASCVQAPRHRPPNRWCDCGFYCLHSLAAAYALACDSPYRRTSLLEVAVSGRYIRYEQGFRYGRQQVRQVRVGRCRCGRAADVLVETGEGQVGWQRLVASCAGCTGSLRALTLGEFAELIGADITVTRDEALRAVQPAPVPPGAAPQSAGAAAQSASGVSRADLVPILAAEAALLQARLDDLQEQLSRLSPPAADRGDADPPVP